MTPRRIDTPEELQRAMRTEHPPSPQQWAAITAPLAPAVVIAGAGSGKTTLMAARVVYLVLTGQVRPEQVLGLTFTTKAAAELRTRIRDALVAAGALPAPGAVTAAPPPGADGPDGPDGADDPVEPTVLTYNAYAAQLLTEHGLLIGHEPDTRVVTDAARFQLGGRVVDRFPGDVQHLTDHPPTAIQNLLALDGSMSEHLRDADDVRRVDAEARAAFVRARDAEVAGKDRKGHREAVEKAIHAIDRRDELLGLVKAYRRLKADLGLMDFSDQIELGARLADERPEVGERERGRFAVVLLDEYQDTSVAQALMLSRLFSGPDLARGRGHAVTAVGDPNQAIYGWRGASVSNILGFARSFPPATGTAQRFPLSVNRRSDTLVLDVANRVAAPLMDLYDEVEQLLPSPTAAPGEVGLHVHETHADELAWLARAVRAEHDDGRAWSDVGVLVRDNSHAAEVFDALSGADVPVEIVGLSGLLRLPEVAEVVATLHLMQDVTANAALLTLLTGPRWAVGPRDLRLLQQRAAELAGGRGRPTEAAAGIGEQLLAIADGVDPAEVAALDDALHDPGPGAYSPAARERFALLVDELRSLRGHVGEPLLDLVRRIMDASGVDVELASAVGPAAATRRENLDLFVKAVADFRGVDGEVTLPALLAYLTAEEDGAGLDLATPTEADSVKLLTVHRSKGLEWPTVFLVGVGETRFPSNRSRTLWTSSPAVLPAPLRGDADDLPQLAGHDKEALEAYRQATRDHDAQEELRLAYVALTRAEHREHVSSYCWGSRSTPFGPSAYQRTVRELLAERGLEVASWREKPAKGEPNPYADVDTSVPWPHAGRGAETALRLEAAARVQAVREASHRSAAPPPGAEPDVIEAARIAEWDDEIERLLTEARSVRAGSREVTLPSSLSATSLGRLREDPEAFARDLARPMPRPPAPEARFGTRFHAWVEARFGQQLLLDTDDLPGRADGDIEDDADLAALAASFERSEFAERAPHAVEPSFALVLAGQVVRGRIDAVYAEEVDGRPGFLLVDWKTSRAPNADPLQLAVYRLAWAELHGMEPAQVRAAFFYVRTGRLVEPPDLPGRPELEALLSPSG